MGEGPWVNAAPVLAPPPQKRQRDVCDAKSPQERLTSARPACTRTLEMCAVKTS